MPQRVTQSHTAGQYFHNDQIKEMFFFFNDTATTEIYTLSLHDALPISRLNAAGRIGDANDGLRLLLTDDPRSEEHTSELQSRLHLVCRLLLEKKNSPKNEVSVLNRQPPTRGETAGQYCTNDLITVMSRT